MNPVELIEQAGRLGLKLQPLADGKLRVTPAELCPPAFAQALREQKEALLALIANPSQRGWKAIPPAALPLNPIPPRPTATNRERVIGYLLRQGCDRPGPLTAWLLRREDLYFDGPGRAWDCGVHCYAAARDAACWQTGRDEAGVWELLEGLAQTAEERNSNQPQT